MSKKTTGRIMRKGNIAEEVNNYDAERQFSADNYISGKHSKEIIRNNKGLLDANPSQMTARFSHM